MTDKVFNLFLTGFICLITLSSCNERAGQDEKALRTVVPVTLTSPRTGEMAEYTELMATSAFLVKAAVKSPVTGYVDQCSLSPGDKVLKNQVVFLVRTKESAALQPDSAGAMNISGTVEVRASLDGVVSVIDHPQGDFVQEGDALCTLVQPGSLVFLLEVPYEMKKLIGTGQDCKLILPDNTEIPAFVKSLLPSMSGASQTQRMVLQPRAATGIPENLLARVKIVRKIKQNAVIFPRSCLLTDEIMEKFWVMKMINDTMAVKVPVVTGITGTDSIEVVSPVFTTTDRILTSGNYGLGDTAIVSIIRHE